jgi:hypothetical protein
MASTLLPTRTEERKYYDAKSGKYVVEKKEYYDSPPWPVKEQETVQYSLPFTVEQEGFGNGSSYSDHPDDIDPDTFYLFGDEEEEEKKEKEKIKAKYDARREQLRRFFVENMAELSDVKSTWESQWLLYTMQDLKERMTKMKEGEEEEEVEDDNVPLRDIKIEFTCVDHENMKAEGRLIWTSLKAPLEMVQEVIDWRLGDRMRYYGFENTNKYSFEFIPGDITHA